MIPQSALMSATGVGGGGITYKGSVTNGADYVDTAGMTYYSELANIDITGIASAGDLVVCLIGVPYTLYAAVIPSVTGVTMTKQSHSYNGGHLLYYGVLQSGDSGIIDFNVPPEGYKWAAPSCVFAVFDINGASVNAVNSDFTEDASGALDPPSLTASGNLWIVGSITHNGDAISGAPSGYTLADTAYFSNVYGQSRSSIAYKIADLSSDNPGVPSNSSSGDNTAITAAFDLV